MFLFPTHMELLVVIFFPCLDVIHVHYIGQTNAKLGFDLVAHFKLSMRCNHWSNCSKISIIDIEHLAYVMREK